MMSRVVMEIVPGEDLVLFGIHAVDLSHLLAELIENATLYSSPVTSVTVRTHRSTECYRIYIVDAGVGMTGEQLAVAHRSMSSHFDVDEVTVGQVGFQVVGRLAQVIGVGVRLHNDPDGGIVAVVEMPLSLFEQVVDDPAPRRRGRTAPVDVDQPVDHLDAMLPADWPEVWVEAAVDELMSAPNSSDRLPPQSPLDIALPGLVTAPATEESRPRTWQPPLPRRQPPQSPLKRPQSTPETGETPCDRPRLPTTRISSADHRGTLERRRSLAGFTQAVARGRDGADIQDGL
jgi:hypothetical protein